MYELALFAGAGGGILGGKLLGWRTVCAVEFDAYARAVLAARQNDGCLDPFPIWDDVRTFTKRNNAVRPLIRALRRIRRSLVISGGFPCQDISCAGKGAGLAGAKSGLWREFARIIREIRPAYVFVENSPMLTSRGLGRVLGDLAAMGYNARWGVLGAVHAGAPHRRLRIWIVADSAKKRRAPEHMAAQKFCARSLDSIAAGIRESLIRDADMPANIRKAYDVAGWVDRLERAGNGQVPDVVRLAWNTLAPETN